MASWTFLTYHVRVLLLLHRVTAAGPGSWPPSGTGYVVKQNDGHRNCYQIQAHLPLPEPDGREPTVEEILALLTGTEAPAT